MSKPYSQFTALMAITKGSLKAIFKSPQAVFFSLFFPIVLIVIFGSLGGDGSFSMLNLERGRHLQRIKDLPRKVARRQ